VDKRDGWHITLEGERKRPELLLYGLKKPKKHKETKEKKKESRRGKGRVEGGVEGESSSHIQIF
jgi:hypothetical protein